MNKKQRSTLIRITISAIIFITLFFIPTDNMSITKILLSAVAYLVIGYDVLIKAFKDIIRGRLINENFLMAVATIGAVTLAFLTKSGDFTEAIAVMLFYQIGELFESYAVSKSRRSISELMDIRPDRANIEINGELCEVDPCDVPVGSVIIVNPGEKIPIDSIVTGGNSNIDTTALTGESLPRSVSEGDEVISGCINMSGVLRLRTTKEFGESTVSKILELVEESSLHKSKSESFITKFARIYTPAVCIGALALAVIPPIVSMLIGSDARLIDWVYRALTFLVISCPCAIVISVPLGFFAGIGGAGKSGILIKGSEYIETLSKVKTVVFDKTGTLTKGTFEVTGIHHNELSDELLLEYAAYAECSSNHPISKSLKTAYGKDIDRSRISDYKELSGYGILTKIDNKQVAVGNNKLMDMLSIPYKDCHTIGTVIHLAIDGKYAGHIVICDDIKNTSKEAIDRLRSCGISKTVMLTGDKAEISEEIGKKLMINEVYSELLPQDKVNMVEKLLNFGNKHNKLAFVGDGINDAPVLTRADIGIAMGALGSDAAIEAADVVLMDDDPIKISKAVRISKKCLRIVYENIVFALSVKFLCLLLGALGITNMWIAIFADVGVMVLAVLNSIRAINVKRL